jgi:signal transduction histidine kinase
MFVLIGIMFIGVLTIFAWNNYRQNLAELKSDIYRTIHEIGWNDFFKSHGETEAADIGDVEYCIFSVDDDHIAEIYSNHYPDMPETKLLKYGQKLATHWKGTDDYPGFTYIYVRTREMGRFIILISGKEALESSLPVITACVVLGIFGLLILWLAAKKLSGWMVQPIEEMIESEKLFMSNASHELKTPLTVIRANSELLSEEFDGNKNLEYIKQETDRMIALVGKMLTLVRLDAPGTEQSSDAYFADEALLEVIYPMEQLAYEKQIVIKTDIMQDMKLSGDCEQMKSVMSILLDNAIRYTDEGGKICVEAGINGRRFLLTVSNTGEAIPTEKREKLFERFYRQDEARGDSETHFGLGLSIAGKIVENQHGKIWVESKNGENIFYVSLPVR